MKRSLLTLLLTAFCFAAFSMDVPQQDTTKMKQQHARKMNKNMSGKKMKSWKKTDSMRKDTMSSQDTMNNKTGRMDSTVRPQK
jgi:hypothetical protein